MRPSDTGRGSDRLSERAVIGRLQVEPFSHLQTLPPEPEWLWRGMLAKGSLTMLAAHPFAGKSMLVGGLLKALDDARPFLGLPTQRASALLVTEEDATVLRSRAASFVLFGAKSRYVARSGSAGLEWEELVAAATEQARDARHELLVFDTFAGLAGLRGEEENDAGAITMRLRSLRAAAADGLAVLFLHHMNGYGQPRGSRAFRGMVDISLLLTRPSHGQVVTVAGEGRFPGVTAEKVRAKLVEAPDGWFYEPLDGKSTSRTTRQSASADELLLRALAEAGGEGLTYRQIDQIEGLSVDMAKRRLPEWREQEKVTTIGSGRKGGPYRWVLLPA
jgi:hypothetical protein